MEKQRFDDCLWRNQSASSWQHCTVSSNGKSQVASCTENLFSVLSSENSRSIQKIENKGWALPELPQVPRQAVSRRFFAKVAQYDIQVPLQPVHPMSRQSTSNLSPLSHIGIKLLANYWLPRAQFPDSSIFLNGDEKPWKFKSETWNKLHSVIRRNRLHTLIVSATSTLLLMPNATYRTSLVHMPYQCSGRKVPASIHAEAFQILQQPRYLLWIALIWWISACSCSCQ